MRVAVRLLLVLLLATPLTPTPAYGADQVLCTIRDERVPESSGLAAAGSSLWTVNDGGSRLQIFQLDRTCRITDTVEADIDPRDVEDLARARDGTFWLADTGDNGLSRSTVALERIRPDGAASLFRLTYPDGPHDAEALLLGADGTIYISTKEPLISNVYTPDGPLSQSRPTPLRRVASVSLPPTGTPGGPVGTAGQVVVTGGTVSAGGTLVVLRTYTDAYVWAAPDGDVEAALSSGDRRRIALPATDQGEAIAVSPDGASLLTTTEGLPGPVHQVPLGDAAVTSPSPSPSAAPSSPAPAGAPSDSTGGGPGDLLRTLLLPILGVVAAGALVSWLLSRR